jgi:hypothetical protein
VGELQDHEGGSLAIENARLARALEVCTRELTDAVEQQRATSEILRVISQSRAEVPFERIVRAALELCDAVGGHLHLRRRAAPRRGAGDDGPEG